jgi:multidrug efflux pump subunit AcrB
VNSVNTQALTLPSGTAKIADKMYNVRTNALPVTIDDLNKIPVKFAGGATVFLKSAMAITCSRTSSAKTAGARS